MNVWENSKKLWKHSPAARVPTAFLVLPNFHSCFYNSIETRHMFPISEISEHRKSVHVYILKQNQLGSLTSEDRLCNRKKPVSLNGSKSFVDRFLLSEVRKAFVFRR